MKFDEFVKVYEADIKAFFESLIALVKTLIEKLTGGDAEAEEGTEETV